MAAAKSKRAGCLRIGLILVLVLVSFSFAFLVFTYRSGLYELPDQSPAKLVIRNGLLFDGLADSAVQSSLVVEGGQIICIGLDCETPLGAEVIDAQGKAILPGLIDMAVQFYAPSGDERDLSVMRRLFAFTQQRPEVRRNFHRAGITGIRSIGDALDNILALRAQIEQGDIAGPKVYCVGLMITAQNGHPAATLYSGNQFMIENGTRQVSTVAEAREAVRYLADYRVDGVKTVYWDNGGEYPRLKSELLQSILSEARAKNLWSSVLTGSLEEVRTAAQLGARMIEYGSETLLDSATINSLLQSGSLYLPFLARAEVDSLSLQKRKSNVQRLLEAGVPVGLGSDAQGIMTFGRSLHREMELLVEAGMSPVQVLQTATNQAAVSLQSDDIVGSLQVGKQADLILVAGKPWENISDIRQVDMLVQKGNILMADGKLRSE